MKWGERVRARDSRMKGDKLRRIDMNILHMTAYDPSERDIVDVDITYGLIMQSK